MGRPSAGACLPSRQVALNLEPDEWERPMHIDLLSPASFAAGQPHDQYRGLREHAPVRWGDEPGARGVWAGTRHADVWAGDRGFQAYSSEPTIMITDPPDGQGQGVGPYKMMLMMAPPEHTGFRKLIRSEFTLPAARLREERIQALAKQIVDAVIEKGECDFVGEVAGEMPSFVIAELMGLPLDDGRELYKLTETIHTAPEALPPGAGGQAVMKMFEYASGVIAESGPGRPTTWPRSCWPARWTAASSRTWSSCCSSCCWSTPAATPPATSSPAACWR